MIGLANSLYLAVSNCNTDACEVNLPVVAADGNLVKTVLTLVFGVIGALAVFFVVVGGFKFVTSSGDPQAVSKARGTVIYAVIGLAVAVLAEVIVNFVIGAV